MALDERVEGGAETEIGETLETKVGTEKGADDPCPVGGIDLNEGFKEKVDEVKTIG